jgi:hypothetical protein
LITFAVSTGTAASGGGGFFPEQATRATAKNATRMARTGALNERRFGMTDIMDECEISAAQHGVKTCEPTTRT